MVVLGVEGVCVVEKDAFVGKACVMWMLSYRFTREKESPSILPVLTVGT